MIGDMDEPAPMPEPNTPEYEGVLTKDTDWYSLYGVSVGGGPSTQTQVWKVEDASVQRQVTKLEQAASYFQGIADSWDTLTNGQKDTAMENAMRFCASLSRYLLKEIEP